ncbi:hypothetical protein [Pontibacter actiniarum]|uniref:SH3 domain-containing protein n=1 Tax=Pontibacter actiniarum TaxID=323450 RepID=A0A1X9YU52_9BACT|nr:hypothetical protein [Pontibacter actiniarum]ARS36361.1 hypothetical protein CA264_13465 [Pontibacter actiniarum]
MKKTFIALLAILGLGACGQQESELTRSTAAVEATAEDTVASATEPTANCQVAAPVLLPPQQPVADPSLASYLQQLQEAVQTLDEAQLRQLLSPNISTSFGGSGGWESFQGQWHPENDSAEVWLLLERLLRLGGGYPLERNQGLYALPYVYSNWPDSLDAFSHVAVTSRSAVLRQEPAANAPAVCTLDRLILQADYAKSYPQQQGPQKEWWYVETTDGSQSGYINHADVYSPVGYRAIFNKDAQGQWRMTALVSGD